MQLKPTFERFVRMRAENDPMFKAVNDRILGRSNTLDIS